MIIDSSLALINRTGAYYILNDICQTFVPNSARARYWRFGAYAPDGLLRKIAARLMIKELIWLRDSSIMQIRRKSTIMNEATLFLDPLYVLRADLRSKDIVLCHDCGPISHSFLYTKSTRDLYLIAYEKIRKIRPGIVFVSEWSEREFIRFLGDDYRFMKVISLYVRSELYNRVAEPLPTVNIPFFLTVGALERRKNHITSLTAFRDGGFHKMGFSYVLCGSRGDASAEVSALAHSIPGVVMPGYVTDGQLRWLYENAEAFVLPSWLEGFGMPALEAASAGLLPIISRESALVEAVNGMCMEVSPNDWASIANAMHRATFRTQSERKELADNLRSVASMASRERFIENWREVINGAE